MEHAVDSAKHSGRSQSAGFSARRAPPGLPPLHPMLQLQRDIGNQAVLSLLRSGAIQAKLAVGAVDDPLEHEADRVADQVMRMPDPALVVSSAPPQISRKCAACEEEEKTLQTKSAEGSEAAAGEAPSAVHDVLCSAGQPLERQTQSYFQARLGRTLDDVRVHHDDRAATSAQAIGAEAYTVGSHIAFARGRYDPQSPAGRGLLAHELVHVVQQASERRPALRRQPVSGTGAQSGSHGQVFFVQVDRGANTITFVTETGSLVYTLDTPTEVPVGNYTFSVEVHGNNLTLTAPGEATGFSGFRYRIAPGQPNPADLLRRAHNVSVMVIEGGSGASFSTGATPGAAGGEESSVNFNVQLLDPATFRAMTGASPESLPEGTLVSGDQLPSAIVPGLLAPRTPQGGSSSREGAGLLPGVGGASILTRFPSYPIPPNATGIIWTQVGAGHLTEFANVGGNIVPRGFRYDMWWNLFPSLRETGVPGSFQNDFLFTLFPRQTIVYRSADPAAAQSFAERLLTTEYNQTYRFPPRARSGVTVCGTNCITVPADEVAAALGVRPEILTPEGPVDILRMGRPRPGAPFEASQAGRGTAVREWLGQPDPYFTERRLTRMPVPPLTPAARGAVGFIKVGGYIMLIYGAYRTAKRISETPEAERPRVELEEGGSWVGGAIGSALGAAAAGAVYCAPAGPADFICVAGGFLGSLFLGAVGSAVGSYAGDKIDDWLNDVAEQWRQSEYRNRWGDQDVPPEILRAAEAVENDPFWGLAQ